MSDLIGEMLLRLVKPTAAALLGAVIYLVALGLGEPASVALALLAWLSAAAFIVLIQEGPI